MTWCSSACNAQAGRQAWHGIAHHPLPLECMPKPWLASAERLPHSRQPICVCTAAPSQSKPACTGRQTAVRSQLGARQHAWARRQAACRGCGQAEHHPAHHSGPGLGAAAPHARGGGGCPAGLPALDPAAEGPTLHPCQPVVGGRCRAQASLPGRRLLQALFSSHPKLTSKHLLVQGCSGAAWLRPVLGLGVYALRALC